MVVDYVLSNFLKKELETLFSKKKEIIDKVYEWLKYSG
jgi:peptidyl-tRNA hydrolase